MKKLLRNKKGFTLIELIVVILILAVLAAILVPSILNYVGRANDSRDQANARQLYSEISITRVENEGLTAEAIEMPDECSILDASDSAVTGTTPIPVDFKVKCNDWVFDGTNSLTQ